MIKVQYFAGIREALGVAGESLPLGPGVRTIADLMVDLVARHGEHWERALLGQRVLMAVNQTMARPDTVLEDGDEVAFFPPVTGG